MIKSIDNKFYDISTPAGKAAYTIAAIKHKKAMKVKKKNTDINNFFIHSIEKCKGSKNGQR